MVWRCEVCVGVVEVYCMVGIGVIVLVGGVYGYCKFVVVFYYGCVVGICGLFGREGVCWCFDCYFVCWCFRLLCFCKFVCLIFLK